jgi:hypothetical protein
MSQTRWFVRSLLVASLCSWASAAAAQPSVDEEPARYVATLGAGIPLRLTTDDDYGQDTFAPAYSDLLAGYVFAGQGTFRHGLGLGMSLNLSRDGGYSEPVYSAEQLAVMPAYLLYAAMGRDVFGMAHLGVPFVVTADRTFGVEVAAAAGYRLLAGLGLFAELALGAFVGSGSTLNPVVALEAGLFLDYEVLP